MKQKNISYLNAHSHLCTLHFVWQIVDSNKGGVVAEVEGLKGFVPFSQISTVSSLPTLTFMDLHASEQSMPFGMSQLMSSKKV